jgi:hypothetical protein
MVMVIVWLLLGENHRLRGRQAAETTSPKLKTTPFRVQFVRVVELCKLKFHLM